MTTRKTSVKDKVGRNLEKQVVQGQYGNLKIPEGIKVYKPQINKSIRFDILMYEVTDEIHPDRDDELDIATPGTLWYRRPYKCHKGIGVNNTTVTCPRTFNKPCPICEYQQEMRKKGELNDDELKQLNAKDWVLYAIVPIDDDNYEEEVHLLNISFHNFQKQLKKELEWDEEHWAFPDLEGGYTLKVRFTGETVAGSKPFPQANRIDFEPREQDYTEDWLEEVPNLDEILELKTYDELLALLHGAEQDTEEYEDMDKKEKVSSREAKKRPAPRKKKPATNKEPENEPTQEKEAPREAKKPAGRKRKTTRKDSEEEEDQEPGEAKTRKKRGRPKKQETQEYECPHGLVFGQDWNTKDVCNECEIWNFCSDRYADEYEKA